MVMVPKYIKNFHPKKIVITYLLLSSDIRSEGSIAIVKKIDFDFFRIFDSTSLPQSKNVF